MIIAVFMVGAVVASSAQLLLLQSQWNPDESPVPARISMTEHSPITILGNAEFGISDAVRSGSGDPADPYVISDWAINATSGIGIYIIGTDVNFIIRNVTINSSAQDNDGMILEGVSNAWIHNVTISNCDTGIVVTAASSWIVIDESSISGSKDYGIVTQYGGASYLNITNNRVFANGATGIDLGTASHFNVISNNVSTDETSSSSRRALGLINSANGLVTGNNLTAVYNEALYANTCQDVVVATNRLASVWGFGMYLTSCTGFLIYGNSFMGVPQDNNGFMSQAYDKAGSENAWNTSYPTGGNFWIDYTGVDVNGGPLQDHPPKDGIGDTPYSIDSNSKDQYPLNKSGPIEPIPEFPTLLLPMISVLAMLFAIIRRSPRKEF